MKKLVILLLIVPALVIVLWNLLLDPGKVHPNIVLITLDTTRVDHLSCYGYERKTTPHLDQLGEEGQIFQNAVAVSSWTLPTHASLFTGLYPSTHSAHNSEKGDVTLGSAVEVGRKDLYGLFRATRLPDESKTLAEILKEAGYKTGGIGAGPWLKRIFGLAQGFDYWDCNVQSVMGRKADEVRILAGSFIENASKSPFFLFLNFFDPHAPFIPPARLRFKFFPQNKARLIKSDPALAETFMMSQYDSEIFFMDEQIGLVLEQLKEVGLYDNTLIIAIGDHGEHFGEHEINGHGYALFNETINIPFIIKWPENWAPVQTMDKYCQQVDILPTILDRLNLPGANRLEGTPLGKGSQPAVCELFRNEGYVNTKGPRFDRNLKALYAKNFKLIQSSRKNDPDAGLYDLIKDPNEENDLSTSMPEQARILKSLLDQWEKNLSPPLTPKAIQGIDKMTEEQLKALGY
jgi:arylsulfatase A-like enzyme